MTTRARQRVKPTQAATGRRGYLARRSSQEARVAPQVRSAPVGALHRGVLARAAQSRERGERGEACRLVRGPARLASARRALAVLGARNEGFQLGGPQVDGAARASPRRST